MPLFPHYSLYPDGAFMMCESVEEFDSTVRQNEGPNSVPMVMLDGMQKSESLDPLTKTRTLLTAIYREIIQPMCNQDYAEEYDVAELCTQFDKASKQTTQVINQLRCLLVKQMGMFGYLSHVGRSRYVYEPFFNMVGNFLTKREALKRTPLSQYHFEYYAMPDFNDPHMFSAMIEMVERGNLSLDDILRFDIVKSAITDYGSVNAISDSYAVEFLNHMFDSDESQERFVYFDVALDDLFREYECEMVDNAQRIYNGMDRYSMLSKQFLCMASKVLRRTCQDSYSAYCDLVGDQTSRIDDYHLKLKNLLCRCVNLFTIGTMVALWNANQLNAVKFERDSVEKYTQELLEWVKTH